MLNKVYWYSRYTRNNSYMLHINENKYYFKYSVFITNVLYIKNLIIKQSAVYSICICMFKIKNYSKYHLTIFLRICSASFSLTSLHGIGASWSISFKYISFSGILHFTAILCRTQHIFTIWAKIRNTIINTEKHYFVYRGNYT